MTNSILPGLKDRVPWIADEVAASAGHVTAAPGVTRNDQLKCLGNGVVPQQAAAAVAVCLRMLDGAGAPPATADGATLLPTPKTGDNRNSRVAITGANSNRHGRTPRGSASGLGLEQALEVARGEMPRELLPGGAA